MYMKLKDGKSKVLTLSYDDGVVQDIRLMKMLDQYGLKCTFNISSGRYVPEEMHRQTFTGRMKLSEAKELYIGSGHEVAIHGFNHPHMARLKSAGVLTEVLDDRKGIEQDYGMLARGMAYPHGEYSDEVVQMLKQCGIVYSRTTQTTEKFTFPENWLTWHPTCHHKNPRLMELAKQFAEKDLRYPSECRLFYLWGHSYEFDNNDNWQIIEEFSSYIGGRDDVWYATNIEIYDYVRAYESLQTSVEEKIVHNPSAIDVWFFKGGKTYCVPAGKTIEI